MRNNAQRLRGNMPEADGSGPTTTLRQSSNPTPRFPPAGVRCMQRCLLPIVVATLALTPCVFAAPQERPDTLSSPAVASATSSAANAVDSTTTESGASFLPPLPGAPAGK